VIVVDGEFIARAETFYVDISEEEPEPVAFWAPLAFHPKGMRYTRPKRKSRKQVMARIDHGRWVVDCAYPRCNAAQVASETDPRFLCHVCFNAGEGGAWMPVVWPPQPDRNEIETLLLLRPEPEQRNWWPHETIDVVRAENVEHGCSTRTEG
jgi:ribosomal protein L37AE/L43A